MLNNRIEDPYKVPFDWADDMPAECPEEQLYGLLPCGCEGGWWPMPDGSAIACTECGVAM